jgi:chemotaxis receptor (MCP) glutamine deamidase CheD
VAAKVLGGVITGVLGLAVTVFTYNAVTVFTYNAVTVFTYNKVTKFVSGVNNMATSFSKMVIKVVGGSATMASAVRIGPP